MAGMRGITTPLEETAGMLTTRLPYISSIAAKSPRHSTGLNVRAEVAAFRQLFDKQTWDDMVDTLKTGKVPWIDCMVKKETSLRKP